jgi:SAM-dependent methyltransferase
MPGLRWRIVRPLFELLYRNRALYWLASTIPFAGQWRTWQRLVLPWLTGTRVLEVGCGTGTLLADMAQTGYSCAAIDRSPQMVAAARRELRHRGIAPGVAEVRQGIVQHLPYAGASFDSVISTFPTDYIADPAALREIARVLRPGGRLIVVLGAALLPANALLLPLVVLQTAVYGRASHSSSRRAGASNAPQAEPSLQQTLLGALLAEAGLTPRSERVRGPFWDAYLVLGEKSV